MGCIFPRCLMSDLPDVRKKSKDTTASFQDVGCQKLRKKSKDTKAVFVKREKSRPIPEKNISHFGRLPDNTKKIEGNWSQIFCWCHSQVYCFFAITNTKIEKPNLLLMSLSDLSSYISSFSLHFHVGSISVQIKTYFVHLGCLKTYTIVSFWEIELKGRDCMTVVTLIATITFLFINICICDYFDDMIFVCIVYIFESDIRIIYRVFF